MIQVGRKWLRPYGRFFSRLPTEPFDRALDRVGDLHTFTLEEVKTMFEGYDYEIHKHTTEAHIPPSIHKKIGTIFAVNAQLKEPLHA